METWMDRFRDALVIRINIREKLGNTTGVSVLRRTLRDFDEMSAEAVEEQPTPPAESLHEMAKRLCAFRRCEDCLVGASADVDSHEATCFIEALTDGSYLRVDEQIDALRQWAAENPPKPALTGVCALCSNAEVACGNCVHNPRHVDHFHASDKS